MKKMQREKIRSNWGKFSPVSFKIGNDFKIGQSQFILPLASNLLSSLNLSGKTPHLTSLQNPKSWLPSFVAFLLAKFDNQLASDVRNAFA